MLTVGSLFSGIGGMDLGLERAGMQVVWQSEIEPYACRVLKKHWPHVPNLGDITKVDWSTVAPVDVLAGGYPCQPFSLAGARKGQDDPRHLWPHFANAIGRIRPRFALLENVASHLTLGFGAVLADLAALGYDARWDCIPAAAVGAPHLRDRLFVIATQRNGPHPYSAGQSRLTKHGETQRLCVGAEFGRPLADTDNWRALHAFRSGWNAPRAGGTPLADTNGLGRPPGPGRGPGTVLEPGAEQRSVRRRGVGGITPLADTDNSGPQRRPDTTDSGREDSNGHVGPRGGWPIEPDVGRVAHGVPHRMDRLRGLGNAVVPQVAEHLGRIIVSLT